ncbi:MAG: ABC transporter ATP-binding protein [Chloroflexi bacterium]|nr:ABC transporter ATP-binding protein [Chloroflexota bacterium]
MSYLDIQSLEVRFQDFALQHVSLTVEQGQVFVVLGPSGSGKSVLLETIAGFYTPASGTIRLAGRDITHLPPEDRHIGFMFQDYALFPHRTVAENVRFGLRNRQGRDDHTLKILEMLGITHLQDRKPLTLSGGEKQRVALARALVAEPQLFLLDEPLSALDARARDAVREELKHLLKSLGITAVYVTHDQTEGLVMADRMAVFNKGQVLQSGLPADIFSRPVDKFVAYFVGMETIVSGTVVSNGEGSCIVAVGGIQMQAAGDLSPGKPVTVGIRPEDVTLSEPGANLSDPANHLRATVRSIVPLGPIFKVTLDCGFELVAFVIKEGYIELDLQEGKEVVAFVKPSAVHLIT